MTINIDLGDLDDNFEINESHVKSSIEKRARYTFHKNLYYKG